MTTTIQVGDKMATDDFSAWLALHDVDPDYTYKVDIAERAMTVYQYAAEKGVKFVVCKNCGRRCGGQLREEHRRRFNCEVPEAVVATIDPFTVPIQLELVT